ncbi:MAG TPA: hypothetical protein VN722_08370 [Hanamia sp.]|nr:hypothetical protein [Hanamia sp.]
MNKYRYIIGVDTGVNTGIAVWDRKLKKFEIIQTVAIHKAMEFVSVFSAKEEKCFIRVEDARKRTWFGKSGREQLQGAGSVKRDAKVWEDFLTDLGVAFEMVAPKDNKTKLDAKKFCMITGWRETTNEHGRDAAMLTFGF